MVCGISRVPGDNCHLCRRLPTPRWDKQGLWYMFWSYSTVQIMHVPGLSAGLGSQVYRAGGGVPCWLTSSGGTELGCGCQPRCTYGVLGSSECDGCMPGNPGVQLSHGGLSALHEALGFRHSSAGTFPGHSNMQLALSVSGQWHWRDTALRAPFPVWKLHSGKVRPLTRT